MFEPHHKFLKIGENEIKFDVRPGGRIWSSNETKRTRKIYFVSIHFFPHLSDKLIKNKLFLELMNKFDRNNMFKVFFNELRGILIMHIF